MKPLSKASLFILLAFVCVPCAYGRARASGYCQQGGQTIQVLGYQSSAATPVQGSYTGNGCNVLVLYSNGGATTATGPSGIVNTSGTAVTWLAGNVFNSNGQWTGLTITIASTPYAISTCASAVSCTLTSSAGTQTQAAYSMSAATPAAIFADNAGTAKSNPFAVSGTGYWFYYADNGSYANQYSGTAISSTYTNAALPLVDPSNLPNVIRWNVTFGTTFAQQCAVAAAAPNTAIVVDTAAPVATGFTASCPIIFYPGGFIQPANGQTVTFNVQSAGNTQICDISLGGTCTIYGPNSQVIPQWWGAVSDSVTDNTAAMTASAAAAIAAHQTWFLPPNNTYGSVFQNCYLVATPVVVTGSLAMLGPALSQGITGNATGTLCTPTATNDILKIYGANGGMNVSGLSFLHLAGFATGISNATSSTIVLTNPSSISLSTQTAAALNYSMTVYNWLTYTNASKTYQVTAGAGGAGAVIPAMGSGGVLPTGSSGSETHNGITYTYVGSGTTYPIGQIQAGGVQWWFTGNSGSTLTGVTPSQGGSGTPNNYDGMGHSVAGSVPYFVSLVYKAGSGAGAFIHVETGSTFPISSDYFLNCPNYCVYTEASAVNMQFGTIGNGGNVIDGAYIGIGPNMALAQVANNEFYGVVSASVYCTNGTSQNYTSNHINSGAGFQFVTAYVPSMAAASTVASVGFTGNQFYNATYALNADGVSDLNFDSSNVIQRSLLAPVVVVQNVDRSTFAGQFRGGGEEANSAGTDYFKFLGVVQNNQFCGLTFQQVNSLEGVTTIFDWSSVASQEKLNIFCPGNVYGPPYTITTGTAVNMNQPLANNTTGTFTPALQFGGVSTGITYAAGGQFGSFVVNGNAVTVRVILALNAVGMATGNATICGLPFPATSTPSAGSRFGLTFANYSSFLTAFQAPLAGIEIGASCIDLFKVTATNTNSAPMTNSDFQAGTFMELSGTYSQGAQ